MFMFLLVLGGLTYFAYKINRSLGRFFVVFTLLSTFYFIAAILPIMLTNKGGMSGEALIFAAAASLMYLSDNNAFKWPAFAYLGFCFGFILGAIGSIPFEQGNASEIGTLVGFALVAFGTWNKWDDNFEIFGFLDI